MPEQSQQSFPLGANILVVEDERIVALDLQQSLQSMGYSVVGTAATQAEAVLLAMSYKPELILMDINLQRGGDGIEAAHEIAQFSEIPVVFLTAYAEPEILRRASAVAPYGYLVKPVQPRELNAAVQMVLARVRAQRRQAAADHRLRLALDSAQMGVLTITSNTHLVEIDGHFPPLPGAPLRGLRLPLEEFAAHLSDPAREQLADLLTQGGELHLLTRWRADAETPTEGWLEVHASYLESEDAVVGVCRDVTRQINQEQVLKQAAVVFASAADGILILDRLGHVITANPAFERLTGWSVSTIRGRHPDAFLHGRRNTDPSLLQSAEVSSHRHAEVVCLRQDGSQFPAWEHVAPVLDDAGQVSQQVLTFSDISALRKAEQRVHHMAYHDPLTGLGNRNQLHERLGELEREYALGTDCTAAVLFIDLDGFKTINDALGHNAGDVLLSTIGQRLTQAARATDLAIRLGGDEFVVLTTSTEANALAHFAERILLAIREPIELQSHGAVQVSASIGIACFPQDGASVDDLLRSADVAMYAAKAQGKNGVARYHPQMATAANRRLAIEQGLHQALIRDEFSLHWQPQMSIDGDSLIGVEALLRWHSAELGPISPDHFIEVAEETGLIRPIGRWVLRAALQQWRAWQQTGLHLGRLAINVSALQLFDDQFASELTQALADHQVPPEALEIEVTETALQRVPQIDRRLTQLTNIGVGIALDDFGTGYSSLSMLKLLPLNRLKIDRAFIRELVDSPSDQAITRAITAVASALNLELIAEGVETQEQSDLLQQLGVQAVQGWLHAQAMPAEELEQWITPRGFRQRR